MKRIRVIVVDDSAYNRRTITKMLEGLEDVEVVGYAADGEEGIRKIIDLKPDLITLDLEMPRMDGFTLLRIVMNACPTPVIVISSRSEEEQVFKALELGAVDFIAKPTRNISDELLRIQQDLQQKVRNVFNLNMAVIKRREALPAVESIMADIAAKRKKKPQPASASGKKGTGIEVVAIGSSTGGPPALQRIFSAYTEVMPFSVVVSQHMPAGFTKAFSERLNRSSAFEIKEAADGDKVVPGKILIAPGGRNLVFQNVSGEVVAKVVEPASQDRYIPSVDAMFSSLAPIYGAKLLAVVLTGMGNDGSRGIKVVKSNGGQVLAEAEESAVVFGMPREAINTGLVDKVAPLDRIAREIILRCGVVPNFD